MELKPEEIGHLARILRPSGEDLSKVTADLLDPQGRLETVFTVQQRVDRLRRVAHFLLVYSLESEKSFLEDAVEEHKVFRRRYLIWIALFFGSLGYNFRQYIEQPDVGDLQSQLGALQLKLLGVEQRELEAFASDICTQSERFPTPPEYVPQNMDERIDHIVDPTGAEVAHIGMGGCPLDRWNIPTYVLDHMGNGNQLVTNQGRAFEFIHLASSNSWVDLPYDFQLNGDSCKVSLRYMHGGTPFPLIAESTDGATVTVGFIHVSRSLATPAPREENLSVRLICTDAGFVCADGLRNTACFDADPISKEMPLSQFLGSFK